MIRENLFTETRYHLQPPAHHRRLVLSNGLPFCSPLPLPGNAVAIFISRESRVVPVTQRAKL
jgi:hypothetical protein